MVGVFDRVFEIGPVFRAEPHFTTRHVNEYISLDAEMGYIDNFYDVAKTLNRVIKKMFSQMGIEDVPEEIPYVKLSEIRKIIKEKYTIYSRKTDIDRGEKNSLVNTQKKSLILT
jgi:nondiscriminating aspartyl-tRNA synthetase